MMSLFAWSWWKASRALRLGVALCVLSGSPATICANEPAHTAPPALSAAATEAHAPSPPAQHEPEAAQTEPPAAFAPSAAVPLTLTQATNPPQKITLSTNRIDYTQAIPTLALGFNLKNSTPDKQANWTNTPAVPAAPDANLVEALKYQLDAARYLRSQKRGEDATPMLVGLLSDKSPEFIRKAALLELGAVAEDSRNNIRAQQIYGQYNQKWPDDQYIPEVLLRQGHLFREQGLNRMALAKFYAVMTSALALKHDQMDYYARLVVEAQTQIAETHYRLEKFTEAADFFTRLLKLDSPFVNKADAQFKLVGCLENSGRFEEAVSLGQDFVNRYPNAPEQPEVRFHLANALKQLGRNNDAMAQVLALLREQNAKAKSSPETWAYWQQRTGNLIANQLFREGDYTRALEIYLGLQRLDRSPTWQLPLTYQVGMTYERLWQPQKAVETYTEIVNREKELTTNATPGLRAVVDMARWRIGFVQWQNKAEGITRAANNTNTYSADKPPVPPATVASNPNDLLQQ